MLPVAPLSSGSKKISGVFDFGSISIIKYYTIYCVSAVDKQQYMWYIEGVPLARTPYYKRLRGED